MLNKFNKNQNIFEPLINDLRQIGFKTTKYRHTCFSSSFSHISICAVCVLLSLTPKVMSSRDEASIKFIVVHNVKNHAETCQFSKHLCSKNKLLKDKFYFLPGA